MEDQTQQFLQAEAQRAAEELGVKTDDTPTPPTEQAPATTTPEAPVETEPTQAPTPQSETPQQPQQAQEATTAPPQPAPEEDDEPEIPTFIPYPAYQQPQAPEQQPQVQQPQYQQQVPQQQAQPQQPPPLPPLDVSQFTDQYGNVDMAKFSAAMRNRDEAIVNQVSSNLATRFTGDLQGVIQQAMSHAEQTATRQIMAAETEKRGWERTFAKYPQVRENKELRDQIHKMRLGEVAVTGKPVSPVKMAERYFAQIAQAREDGVRQAVETTKVQATAHLESANNTASDKAQERQQNWSKIDARDRKTAEDARTAIVKQMLADGKL